MRKKILFVIPTLDRCGAEKQLTLLAINLPKDRFDVRVAVLTRDGPYSETLRAAGIPIDIVGKRGKFSPRAYFRLKKIIREFRPDVVHTWLFAANSYGRKAAFACGVPRVVCGERCVDPWKGAWQRWVDRKLEPKTDAFAVNSSGIVDFYVKNGIPKEKFVVISNAVSVPPSNALSQDKTKLLAALGVSKADRAASVAVPDYVVLSDDTSAKNAESADRAVDGAPFFIGLVARLWPQKRIKEALWAAAQLKFARLDFYLFAIGDGPERESLLRYRDALDISDRVFFLGERDDVPDFMARFDLLWNCSAYEGQSNSILEAQSFGVPVVASDIPGNRDLVVPGENGVLISEYGGDATRRRTAFARETFRLFQPENAALRRRLGENARKRVETEFSLEKYVERSAAFYDDLFKKDAR